MADTEALKMLFAEFPQEDIHWRAQNLSKNGDTALALAYIDARDVMDRLDEICGADGWQDRYEVHGNRVVCYLSIKVGDEWITKADGAGDTAVEAEKGGLSDAFKRAAVKWGIGRYLYSMGAPWVPCESYEKQGKRYWKRWTADPWSFVKSHQPPPRSARALKMSDKDGKDDWDRVMDELIQDLADCTTLNQLETLKADYRKKVIERRWPVDWQRSLGNEFRLFEEELKSRIPEAAE